MEIANQLGHRRLGFEMTMRYAPHAPDYLSKSLSGSNPLKSLGNPNPVPEFFSRLDQKNTQYQQVR